MISKKKFVEIINRLKATNDTVEQINDILRNCRDTVEADFIYGSSLMICHQDIVIELLTDMFEDGDTISWWVYDLDFGKDFLIGCMSFERNGEIIIPDLSTTEKLYDYLIEEREYYDKQKQRK